MQAIKNLLTDVHTYVIVAMFLFAGLTAITGFLPGDWNLYVSGLLGALSIFIKQNS